MKPRGSGVRLRPQNRVPAIGSGPGGQHVRPSQPAKCNMDVSTADGPATRPFQGYALYILAGLFFSGLWAEFDQFGRVYDLTLLAFLSFLGWRRKPVWILPSYRHTTSSAVPRTTKRLDSSAWIYGSLIILPVFLYLGLTWNQEFPFVGDHDHHLVTSEVSRLFWLPKLHIVLGLAVSGWIAFKKQWLHIWIPAAFLVLLLFSFHDKAPWGFARYPGLGYFIQLPIGSLAAGLQWKSPLNAIRLTNALAVPVWLFVLRPWLLKRWPDLNALAFGFFYFYQKDIAYYFTTAYLEPWAAIGILLACEYYLLRDWPESLNACLILGIAALVKEQAILMIPFLWLGASPWKRGMKGLIAAAGVGLISVLPFASYSWFRHKSEIGRDFHVAEMAQIFSAQRAVEVWHRINFQFWWCGLIALFCVLGIASYLILTSKKDKTKMLLLLASAFFQVAFFYIDSVSAAWTGYSRFYLCALIAFGAVLLVWKNRWLAAATVLFAICNIYPFVPLLIQTAQPSYARNFFEHYDAPLYFPIRSLVDEADSKGLLKAVKRLKIDNPVGNSLKVAQVAYPSIAARLPMEIVPAGTPLCSCKSHDEAILAPFIYHTGLGALPDPEQQKTWARCSRDMENSCAAVLERTYDGTGVGLLGIGRRSGSAEAGSPGVAARR